MEGVCFICPSAFLHVSIQGSTHAGGGKARKEHALRACWAPRSRPALQQTLAFHPPFFLPHPLYRVETKKGDSAGKWQCCTGWYKQSPALDSASEVGG